jgi:hypothetical protein
MHPAGAGCHQQAGPTSQRPWLIHVPSAPPHGRGRPPRDPCAGQPCRRPAPPARASSSGALSNLKKTLDRALISFADRLEQELVGEIPLGQQMAAQLEASQASLAASMAAAFGGDPSTGFMQAYYELQTIYHNHVVQQNARDPGLSPMSLSLPPSDFLPDALRLVTLFSQEGATLVDLAARQLGPQDAAAEQYLKAVAGATLHAGATVSLPAVPLQGAALAAAGATVARITARLGAACAQGGHAGDALRALHWRLYSSLHLAEVRALLLLLLLLLAPACRHARRRAASAPAPAAGA